MSAKVVTKMRVSKSKEYFFLFAERNEYLFFNCAKVFF